MAYGEDELAAGAATPSDLGGAALRLYTLHERPGVRLVGEISPSTRLVWRQALDQLAGRHDHVCFLELSAITFVDVAGASELARTAQALNERRRLVLERPPPELPRILELFWPELRTIEVAA
ncbi:STAS domain-containing protein [Streptomyces sp. NPDC058614]|uniref:STAS domain-containing protein n=1 Tax=Streptomyces sp. NPDC058614 TaxID=3346557 RepID=UPI00364EBD16